MAKSTAVTKLAKHKGVMVGVGSGAGAALDSLYLVESGRGSNGPSSIGPVLPTSAQPRPLRTRASGGYPYDAGSSGRRASGWIGSRLGPTTLIWGNLDQIRARARDEIRNNPWAGAAIDNFESQAIGNGIRPRWNLPNLQLKAKIEKSWARWTQKCDAHGRTSFYGLQAVAAREVFEAGEVLARFHVRPSSWRMRVPLQIQLIEGDQLPVYRNVAPSEAGVNQVPQGNSIRTGIEFDPSGRRTAYHMYKEHPGETMFYPLEGLTFMRVPAKDVLHVYKPARAGLLRGVPHLTAVLTLLYELEQFTDAALVRKKVEAMFAGFIKKVSPNDVFLPPTPDDQNLGENLSAGQQSQDPGTQNVKLEPGTMFDLAPGEEITFPVLPASTDYESFLRVSLHKFAVGVGATYEQVTGDLKGVNYSSIRAGLLDFRRKCEQFQRNVIIFQFCQPTAERWLEEAVMSGELVLPGYVDEPEIYQDIMWTTPGWPWVDPKNDLDASLGAVRAGFSSRPEEVAARGFDAATIDAEQAADNERADGLGLVRDSDPRKILIGRESNPALPEPGQPGSDEIDQAEEETENDTEQPVGGAG